MHRSTQILFGAALIAGVQAAAAEPQTTMAATTPAPSAPSSLVLYFNPGSATVRPKDVSYHFSIKLPVSIAKASRL